MAGSSFPPELVERIEELWKRYPERKAALLPALHLVQKEKGGWLSEEAIREVADLFAVSDAHVKGIVGFYDMFHSEPVGRHVVRLCKTLSCKLRGADELIAHVKARYGVTNGQTTPDGCFTFRHFECLGHCSTAPMMLVDEERYENLTVPRLDQVLGGLR